MLFIVSGADCERGYRGGTPVRLEAEGLQIVAVTYWHTNYGLTVVKFPYTLEFDPLSPQTLKGFTQLPRQDGNANGRIKQYELAVSSCRKTWTTVKSGAFPNKGELNTVDLRQTRHRPLRTLHCAQRTRRQ